MDQDQVGRALLEVLDRDPHRVLAARPAQHQLQRHPGREGVDDRGDLFQVVLGDNHDYRVDPVARIERLHRPRHHLLVPQA